MYYAHRYHSQEYGQHYQNWGVIQDARGVIYAANTDGVLEFDGQRWRLVSLPADGDPAARSLARAPSGEVYVGGVGEVGVLAPDEQGQLRYVSLKQHLSSGERGFEDVWTTHAVAEGVYYQTFEQLMRWDGRAFHVWPTLTRFHKMFHVEDAIYVREEGVGLRRVEGDLLSTVPGGEVFAEVSVAAVLPHPRGLLVSARDGSFTLLTRSGVQPFETEFAALFAQYRPYNAIQLNQRLENGKALYAIATLGGGLVVMDETGRAVAVYRENVGLDSGDFVLDVMEDRQGGLWLALYNGLLRFDVLGALTHFQLDAGLEGTVYALARHDGVLFAATSNGLYRLRPGRAGVGHPDAYARFEPVPDVRDQTWALQSRGGELIAANNNGVFAMYRGQWRQLREGRALSLFPSRMSRDRLYVGLKEGVAVLRRTSAGWIDMGRVVGLNGEVRALNEDNTGHLWAAPLSGGLVRAELPGGDPARARLATYAEADGLPPRIAVLSYQAGELELFSHSGEVQRIVEGADGTVRFEPDEDARRAFAIRGGFHLEAVGATGLVIGDEIGVRLYETQARGQYELVTPHALWGVDGHLTAAFAEGDGTLWLGTEDGLLRYTPDTEKDYGVRFEALIRSVRSRERQLLFGGYEITTAGQGAVHLDLPYSENALRFSFAAPSFNDAQGTQYQYLLEGFDNAWSAWSREAVTEYTNLPEHRNYRFRVRARNAQGVVSREAAFTFSVAPPWYRAWWSYAVYVLLFGGMLWSFSTWRLRSHRRELEGERMVNQRLERMNARLAEANERLRQADRLKDDLLANTSHELRTPLTAILGFSSVLIEEGDEDQRELAGSIYRSGQRLLDTVNALLDMAKLQANVLELNPEVLDVAEVTGDVLDMLQPLAEDKGLFLRLMPDGLEVPAMADRYALERILVNLVANAVKFTDEGGVTVLLDASEDEVVLTVRDTGIGMDAEFLPKLFDAFKQASSGYKRSHEGSGLGLAIVKRVVELLQGDIAVESTPGEGTAFTVRLPRYAEPTGEATARRTAESVSVSTSVLEGARVLVLDPDADTQQALQSTLSPLCTLVLTETLAEALEEARARPFDVILVGEQLGDSEDERRVVKVIRQLPGYERTPLAVLTDQESDAEWVDRHGYDRYLVKPVQASTVLHLIEDLLTRADAALVSEADSV